MADGESAPRYRFGPLERRGLVAGWRGGQIAVVALGLVVAVAVLRARASGAGVAVGFLAVAAAVMAATWPIAGRTAEQWVPDVARHVDTLRRQRRVGRRQPFATLRVLHVDLERTRPPERQRRPGGVQRGDGDDGPGVGVVHDIAAQTFTAVLSVSGHGFVLRGASDKARQVTRWSGVLASLAQEGTAVHRLQWIERSLPDDGAEVRRHLRERAVLDPQSPARRSYDILVEGEGTAVHRHEVMLAVTVHGGHAARAARAAGGGVHGACTVLLREVASLARRLGEAGLDVAGILDRDAVLLAVRRGFDTDPSTPPPAENGRVRRSTARRGAAMATGPMGLLAQWDRLRTDATWHCTYWIAEWPRTDVAADFLSPLLLASEIRRSVAVVMEPVGARHAARKIEQARTADIADAELRRRGGFLATVRRRREEEVLVRREGELADGHASFRFSGFVTVSAADAESLDESCGRIEQAAGQAGVELRRCYGDQAIAFTCTLPFGRGLA